MSELIVGILIGFSGLLLPILWIAARENHHCAQIKVLFSHERDHCGQIGQLQTVVADLGEHLRNMSCEALPPSVTELIDDVRSDD